MDMVVTIMITNVMDLEVSSLTNVHLSAQGGVARHSTINHACSSVRNVAGHAFVFLQGIMGTNKFALATTTGKPRKEAPNALKLLKRRPFFFLFYIIIPINFLFEIQVIEA